MLRSLAIVSALALCGQTVHASTISGSLAGTVATPSGNTNRAVVHEGAGSDTLSWGTPNGYATKVEHGNTSVLTIDGGGFDHSLLGSGSVRLGSLTWINQSNWHAGGMWTSGLALSLSLNTAAGVVARALPVTFTVNNTTDATANTTLNEATGLHPDAITGFRLDSAAFGAPISLGNGYSLTELFFRLDVAGAPGTADLGFMHDGAASGSRYDATTGLWENREGGVSSMGLYGFFAADSISPEIAEQQPTTPVPLPAGALLLLSGLASAALVARRARRKT